MPQRRAILLPGIHVPVAAAHINTAAFGIEEDIIGIAAGCEGAGRYARIDIEDYKAARTSEHHGGNAVRRIQRHGKIGPKIWDLPASDLPRGFDINNRDLVRIRQIYEGAPFIGVQLKSFRVGCERNAAC